MKKKNKIIVGCLSALALVSVTTVGFATWLVGVTQTSQGLTANLEVDNVQNETIFVEAALSTNKITVAEESAVDRTGKQIVGTKTNAEDEGIKVDTNALSFTFTSLTVRIGDSATNEPDQVEITIDNGDKKSTCNKVANEGNIMGATYRTTAAPWYYLDCDVAIPLTEEYFTISDEGTYTTYTLKAEKMTHKLKWGSFFGGNRPTSFYNDLVKDQKFEELLTMSNNAYTELSTMNSTLGKGTLDLLVSLGNSSTGE